LHAIFTFQNRVVFSCKGLSQEHRADSNANLRQEFFKDLT